MTCFIAGLHYLLTFPTRMSKIQISMCLYANFSEKGCVSLVLKRTVLTTRNACFSCIQTHIQFVRLGPSVKLEENNYFLIQFYLQPNSF